MGQAYALRLVLDRLAVHNGVLELLNNRLVDRITLDRVSKGFLIWSGMHTKSSTVQAVDLRTTGAV